MGFALLSRSGALFKFWFAFVWYSPQVRWHRYGRVRRAQLGGEKQRDVWHKTGAEDAKANPDKVKLPREEWLLGHDCEQHAFKAYPAAAKEIEVNGYTLPVLPTAV